MVQPSPFVFLPHPWCLPPEARGVACLHVGEYTVAAEAIGRGARVRHRGLVGQRKGRTGVVRLECALVHLEQASVPVAACEASASACGMMGLDESSKPSSWNAAFPELVDDGRRQGGELLLAEGKKASDSHPAAS